MEEKIANIEATEKEKRLVDLTEGLEKCFEEAIALEFAGAAFNEKLQNLSKEHPLLWLLSISHGGWAARLIFKIVDMKDKNEGEVLLSKLGGIAEKMRLITEELGVAIDTDAIFKKALLKVFPSGLPSNSKQILGF